MEQIRTYLLGIIAAAVVCGIVTQLMSNKGTIAAVIKLLTGVFMLFVVIQPLTRVSLSSVSGIVSEFSADAQLAAEAGTAMSEDALRESIKKQVEAYILDKAVALNAELTVEVTLSDEDVPVPVAVCLSGKISPYAKTILVEFINEKLDIDKENQTWI